MSVAINPSREALGSQNAILSGCTRGREHRVSFAGALLLKTVVRGSAEWSTDSGRFTLERSTCLVLNYGQGYSLAIEAGADVGRERGRVPPSRASTRAELHRRLLKGKALIDDCVSDPLDLDLIAREACLSPYHFHKVFAETFCETPHGYVRRRRLARAAALLESSEEPISMVCQEVGFASVPSFTNAFKSHFGVTPARYRRELQRGN